MEDPSLTGNDLYTSSNYEIYNSHNNNLITAVRDNDLCNKQADSRNPNGMPRGIMSLISFNNQSTSLMSAISINKKYIMLMHETRIFYFGLSGNTEIDVKKATQEITDGLIGKL